MEMQTAKSLKLSFTIEHALYTVFQVKTYCIRAHEKAIPCSCISTGFRCLPLFLPLLLKIFWSLGNRNISPKEIDVKLLVSVKPKSKEWCDIEQKSTKRPIYSNAFYPCWSEELFSLAGKTCNNLPWKSELSNSSNALFTKKNSLSSETYFFFFFLISKENFIHSLKESPKYTEVYNNGPK